MPPPPTLSTDTEGEQEDENTSSGPLHDADHTIRPRCLSWAKLLRRVLDIDALTCPKCSVPMVVIAFLTDQDVLQKILDHLKLPSAPPVIAPATFQETSQEPVGDMFDEMENTGVREPPFPLQETLGFALALLPDRIGNKPALHKSWGSLERSLFNESKRGAAVRPDYDLLLRSDARSKKYLPPLDHLKPDSDTSTNEAFRE